MNSMNDVLGTVKEVVSDLKSSVSHSFDSAADTAREGVNVRGIADRVLRELDLERRPTLIGRAARALGYVSFGIAVGAVAVALVPELRDGIESVFARAAKRMGSASKKASNDAKGASKTASKSVDGAAELASDGVESASDGVDKAADYVRDGANTAEKYIGRA